MPKMKTNEVTDEEVAYLAELAARKAVSAASMPRMKQLAINAAPTDAEGKDIPVGSFHIRGESNYSRKISFVPIDFLNKYIKMGNKTTGWKVENETIFIRSYETAYDSKGGIACGRLIGKAVPDDWTDSEKKENAQKATSYGFLFGMATFPDQEPVLVNFRAPPAKAQILRETIRQIPRENQDKLFYYTMSLELKPVQGAAIADLKVIMDLNSVNTRFHALIPNINEVNAFIKEHNDRIMASREKVLEQRKANSDYKEVAGGLKNRFNDAIPF